MIASTGFFRNKAKNIIEWPKIVEQHHGNVPDTLMNYPPPEKRRTSLTRIDVREHGDTTLADPAAG
jgi:endonuclease III